jgi:hypothetical protein
MKELLVISFISFFCALLYSCCANVDCGNDLFFSIRFEDDQGNNLISDSTLLVGSIQIVNVHNGSQRFGHVHYVDELDNANVMILLDTDSIKVIIENQEVGTYKMELTEYDDAGCCDGYRNFNVYYGTANSCLGCRGNPLIIKL